MKISRRMVKKKMKANWLKKGVSMLLVGTMIMSLAACSKNEEKVDPEAGAKNEAAKQSVYKYEPFEISVDGFEDFNLNSVKLIGDDFYALIDGYTYSENGYETGKVLAVIGKDGTLKSQTKLEQFSEGESYGDKETVAEPDLLSAVPEVEIMPEVENPNTDTYSYISYVEIINENEMVCVKNDEINDFTDPANPVYENKITLLSQGFDGTVNWEVNLSEYSSEEEYMYVSQLLVDSKGNFYVLTGTEIMIFDAAGTFLTKAQSQTYFNNCYIDSNDEIKVFYNGEDYTKFYSAVLNTQTGALDNQVEITNPIFMQANNIYDGSKVGYDALITTQNGISGFNAETNEAVEILNYINSDISANNITAFYADSLDVFYGSIEDRNMLFGGKGDSKTIAFGKISKVAPEDIPDKQIITVGCMYTDYDLKYKLIDFNKKSSEYRLTISDYSQYNTADDWEAGSKQFNNDILAGKVPDIMLVNNDLSIANYVNKGVFVDLYELIDADETLKREDFLQNILAAYEIDGKLYQIMPTFTIETAAAKKEWVGDKEFITIPDVNAILAQMPEGAAAFEMGIDRTSVLNMYLMSNHKYFIDDVTGACNFESQEFKDLLTFVNTLPTAEAYEEFWQDENFEYDYQGQWKENKTLLRLYSIYDLKNYKQELLQYLGEDYSMVGLPSIDSNGSIVNAYTSFAISAKSSVKEGAWEFIKGYFTTESQDAVNWEIPILNASFEKILAATMEKPFYINDDGEKVEYDNTYYVNGEEVIVPPLTQAEVDELRTFITSIDKTAMFDSEILIIIEEESAAYFSGQKSVDEVAKIIQSRVQIFVDENR